MREASLSEKTKVLLLLFNSTKRIINVYLYPSVNLTVMLYADVILPIPLQDLYTYSVPAQFEKQIDVGSRVIVQFGKKKLYTAIVYKLHTESNLDVVAKDIDELLDENPIVTKQQLDLWHWIAAYYMCTLGDVYQAALPSALKLQSETYVSLSEDDIVPQNFKAAELTILSLLSADKAIRIDELTQKAHLSGIIPIVKSLVDKGVVSVNEGVGKDYSAKTIAGVRLKEKFSDDNLHSIIDGLKRAPKQQHLLMIYLDIAERGGDITKKVLLDEAGASSVILQELVKKEILEIYDIEINRLDFGTDALAEANVLNEYQQQACNEIKEVFQEKGVALLHGVTSSGKTEIYIQLIKDTIAKGKRVLYLLPEIALTTQITNRLRVIFGNQLAVYHSRFSNDERAETWHRVLNDDECKVVLGARSAVFLPFRDLGLIIVDEEHEGSYKQQDTAPRYNGRDVAVVLSQMFDAKVLLGTATPAIETYNNALSGKYGLVSLTQRYAGIELPRIRLVNTKELRRKKLMKSILSPPLVEGMKDALSKNEQTILFQNRRGFSSTISCKTCSWTPHCEHCDISLTYHKGQNMLLCHYCGAAYSLPTVCPECGDTDLKNLGYGTERVEEEVREAIEQAVVVRMDMDTTRSKKAYERIINDIEENRANVLIGTQMVSKGLDFDNVSVVGILNADNQLNYPDFRAHEKAFQIITQVSGRAGRKNKQGVVYLQTSHPDHPIIGTVVANDYRQFYEMQMHERRIFGYPPYSRLINIILKGRDAETLDRAAQAFAQKLKAVFGKKVLGPAKPSVSRIQSLYIRNILFKVDVGYSISKVRSVIAHNQKEVFGHKDYKSILVYYDVDPV